VACRTAFPICKYPEGAAAVIGDRLRVEIRNSGYIFQLASICLGQPIEMFTKFNLLHIQKWQTLFLRRGNLNTRSVEVLNHLFEHTKQYKCQK
jgi:hypothetical protein